MSFHNTEGLDGRYHAGDVLRIENISAFSDVIILGFDGENNALVSRPYAYASSVGTTGPVPLLGTETYTLPPRVYTSYRLVSNKRTV